MRRIDDDDATVPGGLPGRMPAAGGRTGSPAMTRHRYELLPRWASVHGMAENARA